MSFIRTRWARIGTGGAAIAAAAVLLAGLAHRRPDPFKTGEVPAYRQKGPRSARVTIIVYSDFQCPFCRQGAEALDALQRHYSENVRVVFRHKPLMRKHPYARMAAQAAECAGQQGKFWELHDTLFSRQDDWAHSPDAFQRVMALAKQTGLDMQTLAACLKNPATSALVETDLKDADSRSIGSTPTFLVDEQRCVGAKQLLIFGAAEIKRKIGS